jgi:hypothetical protein
MKDEVQMFFYASSIFLDGFTVDTCGVVDKLCPPSYVCIIHILICKSMAVSLRDGLHSPSGACLPRAMVQNMKILFNKQK